MDEIILNLIVLGSFIILAGVAFLLIRNKQIINRQNLEKFCGQKGWQLNFIKGRLEKGVRITSPEWRLETLKRSSDQEAGPGSTNIEHITTWFAALPGSTLLIGPKYSQAKPLPSLNIFIKRMIQESIGEEAKDIQEVQIGTLSFQNQFMVWAKDVYEAESFLTPTLQSALISWKKGSLLIKRTSKGLTLELRGVYLQKPEDFLSLVQLGEKLV